MTSNIIKWLNTVLFTVMLTVNMLANLIPLNGKTTGEVSESYPNLFTPAPITFAIWAVIYLFMGAFVIWQWAGKTSDEYVKKVGIWFSLSCIFNTAWVFAWHYDAILLSMILIAGLLVSLIIIDVRMKVPDTALAARIIAKSGFEVYLGWIIVAAIANMSVLLTKYEWNGFGLSEQSWTAVMLVIGTAITVLTVITGHNWVVGVAVIWAYGGILIRHISPDCYNAEYPFVIAAAIIGIMLILSSTIIETYAEKEKYRLAESF